MREEPIFVIWIGIIALFFGMVVLLIYDAATTTYEYIPTSGKVVDKKIEYDEEAIYDNSGKFVKYEDEEYYYIICEVDDTKVEVEIGFMDYIKYKINDIVPLTKTIGYKKGTNEVKRIFYNLKRT